MLKQKKVLLNLVLIIEENMDDILTIEEIKQFLEETNTPIIAEYNSSDERNQPIDSFDIVENK